MELKKILKEHASKINFNEETHQYFIDNVEYASVSNTLEFFKKGLANIPKPHLDNAIHRGNTIHAIIEHWLTTNPDILDIFASAKDNIFYKEIWKPLLINANNYIEKQLSDGYKVLAVEQMMFNKENKIAGTVDLLMIKDDKPDDYETTIKIIDWKTGSLRASNYAQIGIYAYMLKSLLKRALKKDYKDIKIITELVSLKDNELS